MIKTYKDLEVYKEGYQLALEIYKLTKRYPEDEKYVMTTQIRRASLSIILNIVEGYGRRSKDDFKRFLKISYGSVNEVEVLLELGKDLKYVEEETYKSLIEKYGLLGRKIFTLIEKWK